MNCKEAFAAHRNGKSCIKARRRLTFIVYEALQVDQVTRTEEGLEIVYKKPCPIANFLAELATRKDGMPQTEVITELSKIKSSLNKINCGVIAECLTVLDNHEAVNFNVTSFGESGKGAIDEDLTWWLRASVKIGNDESSQSSCPPCSLALPSVLPVVSTAPARHEANSSELQTDIFRAWCSSDASCKCKTIDHLLNFQHTNERDFIARHPDIQRLKAFAARFKDVLQ
jgi:hypothetical protein